MLPTKDEAMRLLEDGYKCNPGPWKNHSIIVAKCAYKIAGCCTDMDAEKAYIVGLLHDIGRRKGVTNLAHVIDGYNYLMKFGYDEAARICMTHSFSIKSLSDFIGKKDVSDSEIDKIHELLMQYEYDDYDRLIQLCDSIAFPDCSINIEERMNDVKQRYGSYPESKWNKNIEIKNYFEKKSGLHIDSLNITLDENEIVYRRAVEKDLQAVFTLYRAAIAAMRDSGIEQWDDLYPDRQLLGEDIRKKELIIGIKNNTIACSYVVNAECDEEYKNGDWKYPNANFCVLHRLCVNPLFQNQGLGSKTMMYIEAESKKKGYEAIRLDSFTKNPYALKLYTKRGFTVRGFVYWRKGKFSLWEKKLSGVS